MDKSDPEPERVRPVIHSETTVTPGASPPPSRSQRIWRVTSYGLLLAFAFFLFFYNLDGRLLWGDETETATLARNVLRFGYPKTFDGLNHISLYGTSVDNAGNAWVWSPWLQEYVAAASFSLFGATTWAARAPFALIGWCCVPLLGWVIYRIYRQHRVALAAMALLASSEIFLLHARQCRYYSISVLAEILFVYAIYQWLANHRNARWLLLLSLLIEFYSNYIVAVANLPVLLLLAWTLYRREKRTLLPLALTLVLLAVLALPWIIYAHIWHQAGSLSQEDLSTKLAYFLTEFNFHFAPLAIGLLPLIAWLNRKLRLGSTPPSPNLGAATDADQPDNHAARLDQPATATIRLFEWHMLVLLPGCALIMAIPPGGFVRYLLPLLPTACLLSAVWIFRYLRWRYVAVGTILTLCLTNALALGPGYPWRGDHQLRWPLFDFIGSLTVPYQNRLSGVLAYLNRATQPGQTIFVFDPEFPLIFYTRCQIIDGRLLGTVPPARFPDWILSESASGTVGMQPLELPANLASTYQTITLSVPASARLGCIPDADVYEYHTAPLAPYVLFKRKDIP